MSGEIQENIYQKFEDSLEQNKYEKTNLLKKLIKYSSNPDLRVKNNLVTLKDKNQFEDELNKYIEKLNFFQDQLYILQIRNKIKNYLIIFLIIFLIIIILLLIYNNFILININDIILNENKILKDKLTKVIKLIRKNNLLINNI